MLRNVSRETIGNIQFVKTITKLDYLFAGLACHVPRYNHFLGINHNGDSLIQRYKHAGLSPVSLINVMCGVVSYVCNYARCLLSLGFQRTLSDDSVCQLSSDTYRMRQKKFFEYGISCHSIHIFYDFSLDKKSVFLAKNKRFQSILRQNTDFLIIVFQ